jgi:hypothetical protein
MSVEKPRNLNVILETIEPKEKPIKESEENKKTGKVKPVF